VQLSHIPHGARFAAVPEDAIEPNVLVVPVSDVGLSQAAVDKCEEAEKY
jgi:hypothetical protein